MINRIFLVIVLSLQPFGIIAAQEKAKPAKPKPVQPPPKVQKGYVPRAEITIIEGEEGLVKEYRINGELRAIKVTPKNGFPPYYLIDKEGSGEFIRIGPDMAEDITMPKWILIEW